MTPIMCAAVACRRVRADGSAYCPAHQARWSAEYEAARLDPYTDRDVWDDWTDGDLERPGDDEL